MRPVYTIQVNFISKYFRRRYKQDCSTPSKVKVERHSFDASRKLQHTGQVV